jgi:hypothetical protein
VKKLTKGPERSTIAQPASQFLYLFSFFLIPVDFLVNMSNTAAERYINQRFSKALSIVEHLPASSSFQPTKEEKLRVCPSRVMTLLGKEYF